MAIISSLRAAASTLAEDSVILAGATTAALAAASVVENGKPWAAINPICHMIDGD